MAKDADLFRAGVEIMTCLSLPGEGLARPGLAERILELTEERQAPPPGDPTRDALPVLVA